MAEKKLKRDLDAPLSDNEHRLVQRVFSDPSAIPTRFKAWLTDYVSVNGSLHISNMPTLKGEEWREVGATGQPAFQNSWTHYDSRTARFCKDVLGWVHLEGIVKSGTLPGVIFSLPAGYRPRTVGGSEIIQPVISNGALGVVDISGSTGNVGISAGSNAYVDLSSIHFRAA